MRIHTCPNASRTEGYEIRSPYHFCTPCRRGVWSMRARNGGRWGWAVLAGGMVLVGVVCALWCGA